MKLPFLLLVASRLVSCCEKEFCLNSSYAAMIFLVDGSSSMGDGTWINQNGQLQKYSSIWNPNYQWPNIRPFVNSFMTSIPSRFTVVFNQYSSPIYPSYCSYCSLNMTRVLKSGNWSTADWKRGTEWTFTNLTNGDTWTWGAVENVTRKWLQKKREHNLPADARAFLLLVTDGEPSASQQGNDMNSSVALIQDPSSYIDIFVVYPEILNPTASQKQGLLNMQKLTKNWDKDSLKFNFNNGSLDDALKRQILTIMCNENVPVVPTLRPPLFRAMNATA